jgi:hypothetical protein
VAAPSPSMSRTCTTRSTLNITQTRLLNEGLVPVFRNEEQPTWRRIAHKINTSSMVPTALTLRPSTKTGSCNSASVIPSSQTLAPTWLSSTHGPPKTTTSCCNPSNSQPNSQPTFTSTGPPLSTLTRIVLCNW